MSGAASISAHKRSRHGRPVMPGIAERSGSRGLNPTTILRIIGFRGYWGLEEV